MQAEQREGRRRLPNRCLCTGCVIEKDTSVYESEEQQDSCRCARPRLYVRAMVLPARTAQKAACFIRPRCPPLCAASTDAASPTTTTVDCVHTDIEHYFDWTVR